MPTRYVTINGQRVIDPRSTRAWRELVTRVILEEPTCWLRFDRICTGASTTGDHVIPVTERPDLALDRTNIRGACQPCNEARRNTPASALKLDAHTSEQQPPALAIFD